MEGERDSNICYILRLFPLTILKRKKFIMQEKSRKSRLVSCVYILWKNMQLLIGSNFMDNADCFPKDKHYKSLTFVKKRLTVEWSYRSKLGWHCFVSKQTCCFFLFLYNILLLLFLVRSLHWPALILFYALFIQWSMFCLLLF